MLDPCDAFGVAISEELEKKSKPIEGLESHGGVYPSIRGMLHRGNERV